MKKLYFDCVPEGGGPILHVYFILSRLAGIRYGQVEVHISSAEGERHEFIKRVLGGTSRSNGGIRIGSSSVVVGPSETTVGVDIDSLRLRCQYRPASGIWVPWGDQKMLEEKARFLSWFVPIPLGMIEGSVSFSSRKMQIRGRGYHDVVEMNITPWDLPLTELLWGRAHCQRLSLVYSHLKVSGGRSRQYLLLRDGESTIVESGSFDISTSPDHSLTTIRHDRVSLELRRRYVLEDAPIVTDARIPLPIRKRFSRIIGNPHEVKMFSDALLRWGKLEVSGEAIHERVLWHWNAGSHHES